MTLVCTCDFCFRLGFRTLPCGHVGLALNPGEPCRAFCVSSHHQKRSSSEDPANKQLLIHTLCHPCAKLASRISSTTVPSSACHDKAPCCSNQDTLECTPLTLCTCLPCFPHPAGCVHTASSQMFYPTAPPAPLVLGSEY